MSAREARWGVVIALLVGTLATGLVLYRSDEWSPRNTAPAPSETVVSAAPTPRVATTPAVAATTAPAPPTAVAPPTATARPPRPTSTPVPINPAIAWLRTTRETGLWSGPNPDAQEFVKVPAGTIVRSVESRGGRTFVFYGGDGDRRRAGEVWIDSGDLQPTSWPRWVRSRRHTAIRQHADPGAPTVALLPAGAYVETDAEQSRRWARVFYLGDGRDVGPVEGWIEAADFVIPATPQERLAAVALDRATLSQAAPEVWLRVPYRSQIDGSPYAEANCGPASIAMILDAFGEPTAPAQLRTAVLELQGQPDCDDCGVFIENLAAVLEARGVQTHGLRAESDALRRWSIEDIRDELRAGRVVVPQVMFRMLPGRGTSSYWGDHYVVLSGIIGDRFIYNDPIDSDGTGYGRVISAEALKTAMAESDFPFAAFAAGP